MQEVSYIPMSARLYHSGIDVNKFKRKLEQSKAALSAIQNESRR